MNIVVDACVVIKYVMRIQISCGQRETLVTKLKCVVQFVKKTMSCW